MTERLLSAIEKNLEPTDEAMKPELYEWPPEAFGDFDHIKTMLNRIEDGVKNGLKPPNINDLQKIYTVIYRILRPDESKILDITLYKLVLRRDLDRSELLLQHVRITQQMAKTFRSFSTSVGNELAHRFERCAKRCMNCSRHNLSGFFVSFDGHRQPTIDATQSYTLPMRS